ncbi:MAG: hypothetical protein QM785_12235 [Pyrinomonadaceae bacterium]
MKKLLLVFAAIMISSFAITTVSAQAGDAAKPKADDKKPESAVVGVKWDVVISAPGQDYAGVLKIEKDGAGYKGSVTTELGEAPLTGIKIDGDSFTSAISVNAMGQTIEGTMSGKAKDGKISGEMVLNGLGNIPYTGKKP